VPDIILVVIEGIPSGPVSPQRGRACPAGGNSGTYRNLGIVDEVIRESRRDVVVFDSRH